MSQNANLGRQYDVYQRYRLLERVLTAAFPDGGVRVLDVGSGPGDLSGSFLPDRFDVTLADTVTHGRDDIVQLSAGEPLPFEDGAFDVAVAMDVVEHVPGAGREPLLRELLRIARDGVVVTYPCESPAVHSAERLVDQAHQAWFGDTSAFLREHSELGLPAASLAPELFRVEGWHPAVFRDAPLVDWLPFTVLDILLLAQFGEGLAKDQFNRRANELTDCLQTAGDHYRSLAFAAPDAERVAVAERALRSAARARTGEDERQIAELLAATFAALADTPARRQVGELLAAKDEHIRKLTGLMEEHGRQSSAFVAVKDEHIRKLEAIVHDQALRIQLLERRTGERGSPSS